MKNKAFIALISILILLSPWTASMAMEPQTGNIHIGPEEMLGGNLYAIGESIVIEGTVNGDLIAIAEKINVSGRIEGDIITLAQEINISGEVMGNIRVAGNWISIDGSVQKNLNALGSRINLGPNSRVGWDAYLMGEVMDSRGIISGSLNGYANSILLSGQIGKNANFKIKNQETDKNSLIISDDVIINGNLHYQANQAADISPQAMISGNIAHQELTDQYKNKTTLWLWRELFFIFGAFLVGLTLLFLGKKINGKILNNLKEDPIKNILPGLLILIASPIIAMILALTLIGLPLTLIILALWLVLIYLAKIFTAILIGKIMLEQIKFSSKPGLIWALVIGVIILWTAFSLPYLGWFINLLATCFGLGGLWKYVTNQSKDI